MKKLYKKPEIFIESFKVSEFIAANCATNQSAVALEDLNPDGTYDFGGVNIFNNNSCDNKASEFTFAENDGACYDIPVRSLSTHS